MTVTITFESHSTTLDNEKDISSGWNDIRLSALGYKQSEELGNRFIDKHLGAKNELAKLAQFYYNELKY